MTSEELRKISLVQMEIMDEIHRVCENNHIAYYMIGGTLLGAVRHGGFIPWDLDIDIAMTRNDYERFKIICAKDLKQEYVYMDRHSDPEYDRPHALVSKKNTRLYIKYDSVNPKRMNFGIYVDIFPLDNAPDEQKLQRKQAQQLLFLRKLKYCRIPYAYSYKKWKRMAHYGISLLLSWIPVSYINQVQQRKMSQFNDRKTKNICSMASQYAYSKQCMPREVYGEPILLPFEGRMYYAPAQYRDYLSRIYGDYMKLPPEEKRKANLEVYSSVEF